MPKGAAQQGGRARRGAGGGVWAAQEAEGRTAHKAGGAGNRQGVWEPRRRRGPRVLAGRRRAARETGALRSGVAHLEHKPDEDAEHQAEADVRMVVNDELLAEERVTFRPPAESHGSGRARPAGPAPGAHERQRKLLQPPPGPPAGPQPARPPAAGPEPNNFWGPPPSSARPCPRRPEPPPAQPPRSLRPAPCAPDSLRPRPLARLTLSPPGTRGGGAGGGARGRVPPAPRPRPAAFSPLRLGGRASQGSRRCLRADAGPCPDRKWVRVSHSSEPVPSSAGRAGRRGPELAGGVGRTAGCSGGYGLWPWGLRAAPSSGQGGDFRPASSLARAPCTDDNEWTVN